MRACPFATVLSLVAALMWLGCPASTEAQVTEMQQGPTDLANAGQGQLLGQCQATDSGGVLGAISNFVACCDPDDCGPCWIIAADGVILQRSTTRNQPLFTDRRGATDTTPIDSKTLNFATAFGPNLSVIRRGPCGWQLEVAYMQIDGFTAQTAVPGTSDMVTDAGLPIMVTNNPAVLPVTARYTSALYSGEINLRRQWTDWLNLSVGLRTLQLDERYHAAGTASFVMVPVTSDVNAFNHLYGLQVGADAEVYNMGGPLLIDLLCKGGIYVNSASQNNHRVVSGFLDESLSSERNQAAFLGEIGVVARYAVTRQLALRASAEAAWLEGVALAPEQIMATNFAVGTDRVDSHGGVFYCGGSLGAELRY
jgi:hypothetical protein